VDRVLGETGIPKDSTAGRWRFEEVMEERRAEERPAQWKAVRRGWCFGEEQFRRELLEQVHERAGAHHYGEEIGQSVEAKAPDHCRGTGEVGLGGGGRGSAAQRRCRESEDRTAVATGNDGQQTMDCETIVDGVGEQCDVLPEAGQETMTTVNCRA